MKQYKKIYIEITNACNLECDFCPKTKRKQEFMGIEAFSKIANKIRPYTDHIYLHVKGEPLLHPELDKILDASYSAGFRVNITTNGTLIDKVADMLISKPAIRQINFSLHSFDGNVTPAGKRAQGNLKEEKTSGSRALEARTVEGKDKYIASILSFANEAINRSEMIIALRLWNLDESNVINLEREANNELLRYIEKDLSLQYKIQEEIKPERGIKLAERLYLNQDYQFKWPDIEQEDINHEGFCYGLKNQVAILVDGTVVPCCLDGEGVINLGNINTTAFSEIIDGKRACDIVNGFNKREAVEELCQKCGYRKRFG